MKLPILSSLACTLLVVPAVAEDTKPEAPGRGKGDGSFFRSIDTNGDRAISQSEAGDKWSRLSQLDKDSDGTVTLREMAAGRPGGATPGDGKGRPGDGKARPGEMFDRADTNGDGKISKSEVSDEAWSRLSRLDTDNDGAITQSEAAAARAAMTGGKGDGKGKGGEFFKQADKNGDGSISKEEAPEAWERLGKLDKNNDEKIDASELAAGLGAGRGKADGGRRGPDMAGGAGAVFSRYDEDKDGKLSESEVPGEMWSKLRLADNDADGLVSRAELDKVYQEREGVKPSTDKKPEEPAKSDVEEKDTAA